MNDLLDIAGGFLYIVFSIILFPLFILVDFFIGALVLRKYVKAFTKKHWYKERHKEPLYHFLIKKHLMFYMHQQIVFFRRLFGKIV